MGKDRGRKLTDLPRPNREGRRGGKGGERKGKEWK